MSDRAAFLDAINEVVRLYREREDALLAERDTLRKALERIALGIEGDWEIARAALASVPAGGAADEDTG